MSKKILILILGVFLGTAVILFLLFSISTDPDLTPEEASLSVTELYGGEVEEISESAGEYAVDFLRVNGHYQAIVNKDTGQVESVELIEIIEEASLLSEEQASSIAAEVIGGTVSEIQYDAQLNEYTVEVDSGNQQSTVIISALSGEILNVSTVLIMEEEQPEEEQPEEPERERIITHEEAVAIAQTVLVGEVEDLEFHQTEEGGFYLVEIENDDTDQEVLVQIHAVRGEILTVQWED